MSKETGTLKELDVKPGDVVAWHRSAGAEWQDKKFVGIDDWVVREDGGIFSESADDGFGSKCPHKFRIISRASDDTPKLWRDMSDEEKGALLLADHEGKTIQLWHNRGGWADSVEFGAVEDIAYRVKPEPVRETVTLYCDGGNDGRDPMVVGTIDLIDGKPDRDSIKMEKL